MSHLLPYDPVAKKRATGIKQGLALISFTEAHDGPNMTIAANDSKPSIGKTGVHLRYHKHHEYKKLMHEQRRELSEWRQGKHHEYKKLMHEQRRELSEWRQDNHDAHKPTYVKKSSHVKKPRVTRGPVKSKQISMIVSQQVAAEMQKYNPSAYIGRTNTEAKASADDEKHLMVMVQSAVSKHVVALPTQPNPIRQPTIVQPAPNWREVFEQYNKKHNKST